MTTDLLLALTIGVLFAVGIYLMMSSNLIKVTIGFLVVGHGTNLLLLSAGTWGDPPIVNGDLNLAAVGDPLPHAFILTSIVITVAVTCFLLALVYRQYLLTRRADLPEEVSDHDEEPGGDE